MRTNPILLNPFSLLMEPEHVLQAMERSASLRSLRRRELHPLDRPLIPYASESPLPDDIDELADTLPGDLSAGH